MPAGRLSSGGGPLSYFLDNLSASAIESSKATACRHRNPRVVAATIDSFHLVTRRP